MMEQQWLYIVVLTLLGLLMGTVFDVYNTVTRASKWFHWLRPVFDIAFWVSSAVTVYDVALRLDSGRLRIYSFILLFIGYLLYRITWHRAVIASAFRIVRFNQAVLRSIGRVLFVLIVRPLQFVFYLLAQVAKGLYRLGCQVETALFVVLRFLVVRIVGSWLMKFPGVSRSFHDMDKLWKDFWDATSKWMRARMIRS